MQRDRGSFSTRCLKAALWSCSGALAELDEVDRVVNAVVGEAGIYAGLALLAGIQQGVNCCWRRPSDAAGKPGHIPDSESTRHLPAPYYENPVDIQRILLTRFRVACSSDILVSISRMSRPTTFGASTWKMGAKITIVQRHAGPELIIF